LAELIGDSGQILGIDASDVAVSAARERINRLGKPNIEFVQGHLHDLDSAERFDAVAGRYVLMFNPDPAAMLAEAARRLRPGGTIAFHEVDWNGLRSNPSAPSYDRCADWIVRTFKKTGTNPHMGQDLHAVFVRAGLPPPSMSLRALIGGIPGGLSAVELNAELAITMAPVMEEQGIVARGEINPADFTQQMVEEVKRLGSVVVGRSEIGAWSRKS
jgi:SAM-dependent methyltransferase